MPIPSGHHRLPSSRINAFIRPERLSAALRPLVADPEDLDFVVRCVIGEGPAHHRGANYALLALLIELLEALGVEPCPVEPAAVPMRLPPHLAGPPEDSAVYPLALDLAPLRRALGDAAAVEAAADCLCDGPPHHVLANLLMVQLIGAARAALPPRSP